MQCHNERHASFAVLAWCEACSTEKSRSFSNFSGTGDLCFLSPRRSIAGPSGVAKLPPKSLSDELICFAAGRGPGLAASALKAARAETAADGRKADADIGLH